MCCRDNGGNFPLNDWLLPFALIDGEIGRLECRDPGVSRPVSVDCALRPTAQSGRGGNGCCDDAVDVYVRRDAEEDVVEDDCRINKE